MNNGSEHISRVAPKQSMAAANDMTGNTGLSLTPPAGDLQAAADGSRQVRQLKSYQAMADQCADRKNGHIRVPGTPVLQGAFITVAAARDALPAVWKGKPYTFITTFNDEDQEPSNCHGYTVHEEPGHSLLPMGFLEEVAGKDNIMVFVKDGAIAHSGIYEGGKLRHLLIGVGTLESTIGPGDKMGYDDVFFLPDQLAELKVAIGYEETTPQEDFANLKQIIQYNKQTCLWTDEKDRNEDEAKWAKRLTEMEAMEYSPANLVILKEWLPESEQ